MSNLDCLKDNSIEAMGSGLGMMTAHVFLRLKGKVTLRNNQCRLINLLKMLLSQMVHNHDCAQVAPNIDDSPAREEAVPLISIADCA